MIPPHRESRLSSDCSASHKYVDMAVNHTSRFNAPAKFSALAIDFAQPVAISGVPND